MYEDGPRETEEEIQEREERARNQAEQMSWLIRFTNERLAARNLPEEPDPFAEED